MRRQIAALTIAGVAALGLLAAPSASATFHVVQVREIYPGSAANPQSEYVELQMWRSGQNFVAGHFVRTYDAAGAVVATSTFSDDVPSGANQSTMLLATPQAEEEFGIVADAALTPAGQLSPVGGAVCWEAIDCVSWGSFSNPLPSPAGAPALPTGIPDGLALRRSISRDCPTALDSADDQDDSAADFAAAAPAPRPNSVPPTEQVCAGTGGGGSPSQGGAPQTLLRRKPAKRTGDRTPTFRFVADETGARFQCKLDGRRFRLCRSPFTTRPLSLGRHRFRVRAVDSEGTADPTPASYRFTVIRRS
jgi:hypothetical protein